MGKSQLTSKGAWSDLKVVAWSDRWFLASSSFLEQPCACFVIYKVDIKLEDWKNIQCSPPASLKWHRNGRAAHCWSLHSGFCQNSWTPARARSVFSERVNVSIYPSRTRLTPSQNNAICRWRQRLLSAHPCATRHQQVSTFVPFATKARFLWKAKKRSAKRWGVPSLPLHTLSLRRK